MIEGSIDNESFSALWLDHITVFENYQNNSHLESQKAKKNPKN